MDWLAYIKEFSYYDLSAKTLVYATFQLFLFLIFRQVVLTCRLNFEFLSSYIFISTALVISLSPIFKGGKSIVYGKKKIIKLLFLHLSLKCWNQLSVICLRVFLETGYYTIRWCIENTTGQSTVVGVQAEYFLRVLHVSFRKSIMFAWNCKLCKCWLSDTSANHMTRSRGIL